ncbi:MAG: UbiA family prenyltransferase [Lentisphaeria bacterium]|jgi:4-hydroxybenzoate polyprenyltransferase|nr:UbiA family prenyltransferase [Lentisphaeria bacterium]
MLTTPKSRLRRYSSSSEPGAFRATLSRLYRTVLLPWSRLVRLPNLLTVPGDMLGGAVLASAITGFKFSVWSMIGMSLCSLLLYCFGTMTNDVCDFPEDSRLRPERPLPSRQITTTQATLAALICLFAALLLAGLNGQRPFLVAIILSLLIIAYNLRLKKHLTPGATAMGLCRGMNFLLGASVVAVPIGIFPPVLALSTHIFMVTWLADGENRTQIPKDNVFVPAIAFLAGWLLTLPFIPIAVLRACGGVSLGCLLVAVAVNFYAGLAVFNKSTPPVKMRALIGRLIRSLIFWQSAWIALAGFNHALEIITAMFGCWVLATLIGNKISSS